MSQTMIKHGKMSQMDYKIIVQFVHLIKMFLPDFRSKIPVAQPP